MKEAIIVGVGSEKYLEYSLNELENLALANNIKCIKKYTQHLDKPNGFTYVQKGKLEEVNDYLNNNQNISYLIINDELTGSQIRNIQNKLDRDDVNVIDRTQLILDIFNDQAQSKEAKIQVEIARLGYELTHLINKEEDYDQQRGGVGVANRGSGEGKLEMDKRIIKDKIHLLRKELKEIESSKEVQSKLRVKNEMLLVSLVGYTNAGKSTLMNHLIEDEADKKVFAKDKLFATLDTSIRRMLLEKNREVLLSDTVGFIDKLPHNLVASFNSTLKQILNADLILQVIDYSDSNYREHQRVTNNTLKEIGVTQDTFMIYVYNKADKIPEQIYPLYEDDSIIMSAKDEKSINLLKEVIYKQLFADVSKVTLLIPYQDSKDLDYLYKNTDISKNEQLENGYLIEVELTSKELERYQKYIVNE